MKVSLSSLNTLLEQVEPESDIILSADRGDYRDIMKGDPFDYVYDPRQDKFRVTGLNSKRRRLSDKKVSRLEKAVGKSFGSESKSYDILRKRMKKIDAPEKMELPLDEIERMKALNSGMDEKVLKSESKRYLAGTGIEMGAKKMYLNAFASKNFSEAKKAANTSFEEYQEWVSDTGWWINAKITAIIGLASAGFVLGVKGGAAVQGLLALLLGVAEEIAWVEAEEVLKKWSTEDFENFGLGLYPLLLLPDVRTSNELRRKVASIVGDAILQDFSFIQGSYGGTGSYEKESDATILYDEMQGFTSKGAWGVEGSSGEAIVADIIKRRSGKLGGKNDLHKLYDEYNKVVAKREGPRVPERLGDTVYYHDLIDWIEDESKGIWIFPQIGGEGKLQNVAGMVRKALIDNKKERYSPGSSPGDVTIDAATLYAAIKGLGTDEEAIEAVLSRRKSSLPDLYAEYNKYLAKKGETDSGDLIDWLEGDGETRSAQIVAKALEDEGVERYSPGERRKMSKKKLAALGTGLKGMSKEEEEDLFYDGD